MVFAAARLPSSRSVRASSAGRSTSGSASRATGSDACCAQARTRAVAGSAVAVRAGLNACWYKRGAQRCRRRPSWRGPGQGGRDGGQRLGHAGPRVRRQGRPLHRRIRRRMLIPGHGHRFRLRPQHGLAGCRVELQALARGADQFRAVALGQRPGDEGLRPGPAGSPPADLERAAPGMTPIRIPVGRLTRAAGCMESAGLGAGREFTCLMRLAAAALMLGAVLPLRLCRQQCVKLAMRTAGCWRFPDAGGLNRSAGGRGTRTEPGVRTHEER